MARRPSLEIDGVTYKNVYEISYEIRTAFDETGRPSDVPRPGRIKVLREADPKLDMAEWACAGGVRDLKSGYIVIRYFNDQNTKRIQFKKAYIAHYEERVPNVKTRGDDQVMEYFEISCGELWFPDSAKNVFVANPWTDENK